MLVDIGHSTVNASPGAEKGGILAVAPVNGHVAKSDAVLAGRIDQLQRKLAFASQLAGLFRNVCAATAFCILASPWAVQAVSSKVTRWSRHKAEKTPT